MHQKCLDYSDYSDIFAMNVNNQINVTKEVMENMHIQEAFKKTT